MTRPAAMLESVLGLGHLVWLKHGMPAQIASVLDQVCSGTPESGQLSCIACGSMNELFTTINHQTVMLLLPESVLTPEVQQRLQRALMHNIDRPELPVIVITCNLSEAAVLNNADAPSQASTSEAVGDFKTLAGACSPVLLPANAFATSLPGLAGMAKQMFENHQQLQQHASGDTNPTESTSDTTLDELKRAQLFESLLQILPVGIAIGHDAQCSHMTMNPAAAQLLDIPLTANPSLSGPDKKQLGFTCLINSEVVSTQNLPMHYAARTGKTVHGTELQLIRADGTKLNLVVSAVPILDQHGKSTGSVGVLVDITNQKKVMRTLALTQSRLNLAQKCAKAGVWDWNLVTGEVTWSEQMFRLFDMPADYDPSSNQWHTVVHPDDLQATINALENNEEFQIEYRVNRKDGALQWILSSGQMLLDERGRPLRMLGVCMDITDHKLAEQSMRENALRFRTMMDASPLGVFITDAQGQYQYTNAVLQNISLLSEKELVEQGLLNLVHPDERSQMQAAWNAALTRQQRFEQIIRLQLPDEQYRWIHIRASPAIDNGKLSGYIGKVEDITRKRQSQAALRLSQVRLQKANESLAQRSEDMEELLSITAHDLKHPVVGIQGLLSLLKEDCYSKLDEENKLNLDLSLGECERMKEMLTRLSELGRIEQTRPRMGIASIRDVVDTCAKRYQSLCLQNNITLKVDVPDKRVRLPKAILEEVLSNLIDNAIKYGCDNQNGIIEISVTCEEQTYCIRVRDNGPGIDPQHHERIFRPFRRLVAKKGLTGSGLGLTAVKRLIQRVGGQVYVESAIGQGACFSLQFPFEDENPCEDVL